MAPSLAAKSRQPLDRSPKVAGWADACGKPSVVAAKQTQIKHRGILSMSVVILRPIITTALTAAGRMATEPTTCLSESDIAGDASAVSAFHVRTRSSP